MDGNLRFLSHRQTATMLERALIRAGLDLNYSKGFNPHPRMSLPLPRTVGVVSENDILTVELDSTDTRDREGIRHLISGQVPECCKIADVFICPPKTSFQARSVCYELVLGESAIDDNFRRDYESFLEKVRSGSEIIVNRKGSKRKPARCVNVGAFIESVELDNEVLRLRCSVSGAGSIRPDEILELLALGPQMLRGAIVRKDVKWHPGLAEACSVLNN